MKILLKGAPAANAITEKSLKRVEKLKRKGIIPRLAVLRVGQRSDDVAYERGALNRCAATGVEVKSIILSESISQEALLREIEKINADDSIHGLLMFRPLPKSLDEVQACNSVRPEKDVDGITIGSMATIYSGYGEGFPPCTAQAVIELLSYYGIEMLGKRVVVIGRSLVIGKPVSMLLLKQNATVTICHTKTVGMQEISKNADIVVIAAGRAESITKDYFRPGQVVVDVGINYSVKKQKLVGDVDFDEVAPLVDAITPVPAGVGSITTAVLVSHVIEAAERRLACGV